MKTIARLILSSLFLLAACDKGDKELSTVPGGDAPILQHCERAFAAHMSDTELPTSGNLDTWGEATEAKEASVQKVLEDYRTYYGHDSPTEATAKFRTGQLYLNLGCEMLRFTPTELDEQATADYRTHLAERAGRAFESSLPYFEEAAAAGHEPFASDGKALAGQFGGLSERADMESKCASAAEHWDHPQQAGL